MSPNLQASFWQRMGLQETDRDACVRAIEEIYPDCRIEEFKDQGYCSFTLLVSGTRVKSSQCIVQIRPRQHSLDPSVAHAARQTYGALAPSIRPLDCEIPGDLRAFEMALLNGTPLSRLLPRKLTLDEETSRKHMQLIESFASIIARAWPSITTKQSDDTRRLRADSPICDGPSWLAQCTEKVGANIVPKLAKLIRYLPDQELRERATETLDRLLAMRDYPVVLNHGDLIPTNVLVDEKTWEITGLVDWAEAEWLPFGTCLYGLEHLLGFLDSSCAPPVFRYYDGAERLRRRLWDKLVEEHPDIEARLEDVGVMRDVGVLLWSGYAWDEGRIDRVVNERDDAEEVACLKAFLQVEGRDTPFDLRQSLTGT